MSDDRPRVRVDLTVMEADALTECMAIAETAGDLEAFPYKVDRHKYAAFLRAQQKIVHQLALTGWEPEGGWKYGEPYWATRAGLPPEQWEFRPRPEDFETP